MSAEIEVGNSEISICNHIEKKKVQILSRLFRVRYAYIMHPPHVSPSVTIEGSAGISGDSRPIDCSWPDPCRFVSHE